MKHLLSHSAHVWYTGLCKEDCSLEVFPNIDNGDACQACGNANKYWQDSNLAALDLNVTVNYTRQSMLIGTTMTTFARDITTMLHSKGVVNVSGFLLVTGHRLLSTHSLQSVVQANAYALLFEPQSAGAMVVPFYPLAPLAAKAEGWEVSFIVSCPRSKVLLSAELDTELKSRQ